jgi:hypothetical protein
MLTATKNRFIPLVLKIIIYIKNTGILKEKFRFLDREALFYPQRAHKAIDHP